MSTATCFDSAPDLSNVPILIPSHTSMAQVISNVKALLIMTVLLDRNYWATNVV